MTAPESGACSPPIRLSPQERGVLRGLVGRLAEAAAGQDRHARIELWRCCNDLQSVRPMVWIDEVPWHEMNVDDALTLRTEQPWAREWETRLRRTLYQWQHLPADMVLDAFMPCPLVIRDSGFGIEEDVEVVRTDAASRIVSRRFHPQIREPEDLDKIRMPRITFDEPATAAREAAMNEVCRGLLPVRRVGWRNLWFTPWDSLIRWWGVEQALLDLIERPEMVHAAVERMVDASLGMLDQLVAQRLLSPNALNARIGSGGYGYSRSLPGDPVEPGGAEPPAMWGCSNAQIFSEVSPDMHWQFALAHDRRWLRRWGMVYYGCCEPLDGKIDILRRIPNLRKISASPWCKIDRLVDAVGGEYVISHKPNPAILAEDAWHPDRARAMLRAVLDATRGRCHVEVILKDISTVRYQPQRLWDWARIAMEEAER